MVSRLYIQKCGLHNYHASFYGLCLKAVWEPVAVKESRIIIGETFFREPRSNRQDGRGKHPAQGDASVGAGCNQGLRLVGDQTGHLVTDKGRELGHQKHRH